MDVSSGFLEGGLFYVSQRARRSRGVALVTHGFFSESVGPHRLAVKIAQVLLDGGINVVRYDMRGCGQSSGLQREMTLDTQRHDLARMAAFVRDQFQEADVFHVALSFGGVTLSLSDELPSCSRVCLLNVPTDVRDVFSRHATRLQRIAMRVAPAVPRAFASGQVFDFEGNQLSMPLLQQCLEYDWNEQWSRFHGRALVVQSGRDELVPPEQGDALREALTRGGCQVSSTRIARADHRLSKLAWQKELFAALKRFITK